MNEEEQDKDSQTVEVSELEIENRREAAKKKMVTTKHTWRQKGGWIACTSCDYPHAIRVNGNTKLIGVSENGMPLFDRR